MAGQEGKPTKSKPGIFSKIRKKLHSPTSKDIGANRPTSYIPAERITAKNEHGNDIVTRSESVKRTLTSGVVDITENDKSQVGKETSGVSLVVDSSSNMHSISCDTSAETGTIARGPGPSQDVTIQATQALSPICELWNDAYDDLRVEEEQLVQEYEATVSKDLKTTKGLTGPMPSSKVERKDLMESMLKERRVQVNRETWKMKFKGREIPLKDLVEPVIRVINCANEYISGALSSNPYASIAWAGVSLLLPLFLNPSKQAAVLAKGLEYISGLIVQCSMIENLYSHRYELNKTVQDRNDFLSTHLGYRKTLRGLYTRILKFQARSFCYYSQHGAFRIGIDIVHWEDWDSLLADIEKQEKLFHSVNEFWKDTTYQEEWSALTKRHQESIKSLITISSDVSGLLDAINKERQKGERTKLLQWLSPVKPGESYSAILAKHEANTGCWLLEDNEDFKSWKSASNSLLWLHGKAGSGKSVLSSCVIKHLKGLFGSDPEAAIGFFYFSFNDVKQDGVGMLRSLIKQLCYRRPDTPKPVLDLKDFMLQDESPDMETLEATLAATMHGFSKVFLVIDALDECPPGNRIREKLLGSLCRIHMAESENLHLLCTSRMELDIAKVLGPLLHTPSNAAVDLSNYKAAVDRDISIYTKQTLDSPGYSSWSTELKIEAEESLMEKADGMFQYIACQFEILQKLPLQSLVRKALKDLPDGLDETYNRMLQSTEASLQKQVLSSLKWLAFSFRPLTLDELAEAFILDHEESIPFSERLFKPEDVLKYIPSLITTVPVQYSSYSSTSEGESKLEVKLAHFSVKEHLLSKRIRQSSARNFSLTESEAHLHIAESCLAYHLQISAVELATEEKLREFALWEYVTWYWTIHLEQVARESWPPSIYTRATQVLAPRAQSMLNLCRIRDPSSGVPDWEKESEDLASPLSYAASIGALKLAEFLLKAGAQINEDSPFGDFGNPLQAAVLSRGESLVQFMLDNGADINAQAGYYGNALQAAACYGGLRIIGLLLENGADIQARGGHFGNALQAAAYHREESVVQILLNRGVDVNAQGGVCGNALQAAVFNAEESTVLLLLDKGADVNAQGGICGNALQAAVYNAKMSLVERLIERGADVNASAGVCGNALQAAVAVGHLNIAELLLSRGAKLDPPGPKWDELLMQIGEFGFSGDCIDRLRGFQEDQKGFLAAHRPG